MIALITWYLNRPKHAGKQIFFRVHSAGDFYSQAYLNKWVEIANHFNGNSKISFQAYTKSLPYLKAIYLQQTNIKFVYSVLCDTAQENIECAKAMGLQCYHATRSLPANGFICEGNCAKCTVCYTPKDTLTDIYVDYHGARNVGQKSQPKAAEDNEKNPWKTLVKNKR